MSETVLHGTPVVPGLAHGPVILVRGEVSEDAMLKYSAAENESAEELLGRYDQAATEVAALFTGKAEKAVGHAAEVLTASAGLAKDKGLRTSVRKALAGDPHLLPAVRQSVEQFVAIFTKMGGLMAERATDLRDIERRLIAAIIGEPQPGVPTPTKPSILVAEDLAPSDTAGLDPAIIIGLVTSRGGSTSHTAIIARQLGIPCIVGAAGVTSLPTGTQVLIDGVTGEIELNPDGEEAAAKVARDIEERAIINSWVGPAVTTDGTALKLLANVADGPSSASAAQAPVQGVGLFRTELCFLNADVEPSVEEQADIYASVLEPFAGKGYVVVRTLDAGSDKPIAYATLAHEENPALGVRGLRLSFGNPGLLERQLDGIASAAKRVGTETWVMAPMVATIDEATDFAARVKARGLKAGVMVEVPSAALLAPKMLEVVDFMSIGTNDLTQYTMAADRMATDLAHLTDPWQPAVLQLIAITAEAGKQAGKPVGVCGEAAADPLLAAALIGMGVTSLSMAAAAVKPVGALLSRISMDLCEQVAEAVLGATDPQAGREAARALIS